MATSSMSPEAPRPAAEALPADGDPPAVVANTAQLARFEFSSDGDTKILMVEWDPIGSAPTPVADADPSLATDGGKDALTAAAQAGAASSADPNDWEVSWPGKSTFLPAKETDQDGQRRRVYFLLPPEISVPASINVTPPGRPSIVVKPLPAIFPKAADAETGSRGVLHTLWAKRRLLELDQEMDAEVRSNPESVGVEMALAEKNWIVDNFLSPKSETQSSAVVESPVAPKSPVSGRLAEKLKGLKLATSPSDLTPARPAKPFAAGGVLSADATKASVQSFGSASMRSAPAAAVSLDAALNGDTVPIAATTQDAEEAELFALPISPRSPDMKKSPFSVLRTG